MQEEKRILVEKLDSLNDLAEGVLAVPMPSHLDRDEVRRKTALAIKNLINKPH